MRRTVIKIVTACYVLGLVGIVVLADGSAGQEFFSHVRSLPLGDKLGHFLLMGSLSLLANLCLSCRVFNVAGARVLTGSAFVALAVAAEEFSQLFIPQRSFDLTDLLFDFAGILLFGRLACLLNRGERPTASVQEMDTPRAS